jgi:hypothetical protein
MNKKPVEAAVLRFQSHPVITNQSTNLQMYVCKFVRMYVCIYVSVCLYNIHIHSKHKWLPSNHYHHHEPSTSLPFGCYDLLSAFVVSPRISPIWLLRCELGSSVSIVSGYRLDDRAIEVRSPAEEKGFFPLIFCVQTGSWAHPVSCTMGTGVLSLGVKSGQGVTPTTHPYVVPRSRMSRSYTSPTKHFRGV